MATGNTGNWWNYRSAKTHKFVGRGYKGEVEIFRNGKWEKAGGMVGTHARASGGSDSVKETKSKKVIFIGNEYFFSREKMLEMEKQYVPKKKIEHSTDDKFVFSKVLERRLGLDESQQKEIWKTLREANLKGEQIKEETNGEINIKFSYNLDHWRVNQEVLLRRLQAAKDVLNDNYIKDRAKQSISDLLEAINNFTSEDNSEIEVVEDFTKGRSLKELANEIINKADSTELYLLLHKYKLDSIAYAWESIIREHNYEFLMTELIDILRRAEDLIE